MSSLTGKILNLIKPAVTDSVLQTIADLASNFQAIDDGHSAHLADGVHQKVAVTSTDNATSTTNAPLKTAGGLAVAKDVYIGGSLRVDRELGRWGKAYYLLPMRSTSSNWELRFLMHFDAHYYIEITAVGGWATNNRQGIKRVLYSGMRPSLGNTKIVQEDVGIKGFAFHDATHDGDTLVIPLTHTTGAPVSLWVVGGAGFFGQFVGIDLIEV